MTPTHDDYIRSIYIYIYMYVLSPYTITSKRIHEIQLLIRSRYLLFDLLNACFGYDLTSIKGYYF